MAKNKNVLLMGVSGAGKSTLINGVVGQKIAKVVSGDAGTKQIATYTNDELGINFIDTRGFEYNILNQAMTISKMKQMIKQGLAEESDVENRRTVDCVWYCVGVTEGKVHKENINSLLSVIKEWKNIPVIVVMTKSFELLKVEENKKWVKGQFEKYGKKINVIDYIPVVVDPYVISEEYSVSPYGIVELIEKTQKIIDVDVTDDAKKSFRKRQRIKNAEMIVNGAAAMAAVVAASPIPHDTLILTPIETGMIVAIGKLYGIKEEGTKKELVSNLFKSLLTAGTVGTVAKSLAGIMKGIPGIGIVAGSVNIIMAISIVELLGQTCIAVFEAIDAKKLDISKLDQVEEFIKKFVNENMPSFIEKVTEYVNNNKDKIDVKELIDILFKRK